MLLGLALGICLLQYHDGERRIQAMPEEQGVVDELLFHVNAARVAHDLPPYVLNTLLTQVAQAHSNYQRDIGHWSHEGEGGTQAFDRVLAADYPAIRVNENIYASSIDGPEEVVTWWLTTDEAHRDNVLHSALREVGFGAATDADGVVYYTMDISAQPNVLPVFINNGAARASDPNVTLALTNENIFSGGVDHIGWAVEVLISNSPDFTGAEPQPWVRTINWTLDAVAETGSRTVYVRFIDENGRTADAQDSIVLEAAAVPTTPFQSTATPTLLPPPATYTPVGFIASPSPTVASMIPVEITPTLISPTPYLPSGEVNASSTHMLFSVILGTGISATIMGAYLLLRSER